MKYTVTIDGTHFSTIDEQFDDKKFLKMVRTTKQFGGYWYDFIPACWRERTYID